MRVKFTIAICALLVLGLAVSEVAAQGYRLSARVNTVAASGNNQELGALRLTYKDSGNVHIPSNNTIEITFGGLTITSLAGGGLVAGDTNTLTGVTAAVGNIDDDNKNQKITLDISGATPANDQIITLTGVRVDVSGLDADAVRATATSTGSSGDFIEEDAVAGEAASIKVSNVKDGLTVSEVTQVSVLTCDAANTGGRMPSIKVEEGFASAWETDALGAVDAETSTHIRIVVANVPTGVTFRWPGGGNEGEDGTIGGGDDLGVGSDGYFAPPMHLIDHDGTETTDMEALATLVYTGSGAAIGEDKTKHWVTYSFSGTDIASAGATGDVTDPADNHNAIKNVFTVSPMVMVDTKKTGMGGVSDVWAQLWPMQSASDDDRATVLSYDHAVETSAGSTTNPKGYFVNVTECVTYLLFPFLTCGAQADWTTGIAVANTSADDEVFPVNAGAAAQGGSVMIHAYPKSTTAEKMAMGHMSSPEMLADPISTTISGNLAAGDSVAITCNMHPMLAGFEGYAIVRAGFRHAHGMAFVLGNFMDGAAIDVAHGYIALVIPDPEFADPDSDGAPIGRGAVSGETLGH